MSKKEQKIKDQVESQEDLFSEMDEKQLALVLKDLGTVHSKDTENVFLKGDCFSRAQVITDKNFAIWLKKRTDYTIKSANNYISISRELGAERDVWIQAGARYALMLELLTASPSIRKTVLERLIAGERVTVENVRKLKLEEAGHVKAKPTAAHDTPGSAGLKRLVDEKSRLTIADFSIAVASTIRGAEKLMAQDRLSNPISKRDYASLIIGPARIARAYLTHAAVPLIEENRSVVSAGFPKGSLWSRIYGTLDVLSSETELAKVVDKLDWLQNEVHPLLTTVIARDGLATGERMTIEPPELVPDDGIAVAEVEQEQTPTADDAEDVDTSDKDTDEDSEVSA